MKKQFLIIGGAWMLLSSCIRNYTCQCTDSNGNVTNTIMHNTKRTCHNRCVASGPNCALK